MGGMKAAEGQKSSSQSPSRRSWLWGLARKSSIEDELKNPRFDENLKEACIDGTPYAVSLVRYVAAWGGEPETILRVSHKPSGMWWMRRLRMRDWLHLEQSLAAESEANIRIAAGNKESCQPARSAADALADAGLLHCLLPPTPMSATKHPTPAEVVRWRRQYESALQGQLHSILNDEERRRSSALQRFLGVPPPEIPSLVRITRFCPEESSQSLILDDETPMQAVLEVRPQDSPEEGIASNTPWSSATHFVAAVAAVTPTPDGADMKVHVYATVVVSEVTTRIECHGLKPAVFYEFEVRAINAVGISGVVMIRAFAPVMAASELPKVLEQRAPPLPEESANADAETLPRLPSTREEDGCESSERLEDEEDEFVRRVSHASADSRASFHSASSDVSGERKVTSQSSEVDADARRATASTDEIDSAGMHDCLKKEDRVVQDIDNIETRADSEIEETSRLTGKLHIDELATTVVGENVRDQDEEALADEEIPEKRVEFCEEKGSAEIEETQSGETEDSRLEVDTSTMASQEDSSSYCSPEANSSTTVSASVILDEKSKSSSAPQDERTIPLEAQVGEHSLERRPASTLDVTYSTGLPTPEVGSDSRERLPTADALCQNTVSAASSQKEIIDAPSDRIFSKQEASSSTSSACDHECESVGKSREAVNDAPPSLPRVPPGFHQVVGFILKPKQLPPEAGSQDIEALVAEVQTKASKSTKFSKQQALRMLMGMNMDINSAMQKFSEVASWRQQHGMEKIRSRLLQYIADTSGEPITFPHADTTSRLCKVAPCCLRTSEGWPVSVWHVGTASTSEAGKLSNEHLQAWSCAVFEYVDLWISEQSEHSGYLGGHVQIFNLDGIGFWQSTNSTLIAKIKAMLGAGGMYVETISHIYVINSSAIFSAIWKIVKTLITPRTASKITVAAGIPPELMTELGAESAQHLKTILKKGQATVLRPPASPS